MTAGESGHDSREALEFGWRVHAALESWTTKVDGKASIALAVEAAAIGFVVTMTEDGRPLDGMTTMTWHLGFLGFILLGISALLAVAVVFPQLRGLATRRNWQSNMIYFGHLRFWEPGELADQLQKGELSRIQLANQMVQMSKIAWRKHVMLQWSLAALVLGCAVLAVCGYILSA